MSGFDFQPALEGELIRMRPFAEDDFDALFAVCRDPLIWALHPVKDRWKEPVFRQNIDDAGTDQGALVAIEKKSGEIVGMSRYSQRFTEGEEVEIGWSFLARTFWGGIYNRDMKRQMVAHALESFPQVMFRVGEHNLRSQGAMKKIGGVLTDRTLVSNLRDVEVLDLVFVITRENFANGPMMQGH